MKLDILAFGAHPDDVEISIAGTMAKQNSLGQACGVVDLTQGQLGTRGTPEIRLEESEKASKVMGLKVRENLGFADGLFSNDWDHQQEVIKMIRQYRPEIVIANAPSDRHPDHGRGAELVKTASFLAGLRKIETRWQGQQQKAYRPQLLLHYIQFQSLPPDIIMNIDGFMDTKLEAIKAYASQFYDPDSNEPSTVISSKNFLQSITYRAQDMGRLIGASYGEGLVKGQDLGITDLMALQGVR